MREMNKSHWAESYIGRPYVEGAHDCADFVVAVMREHFGRELALPAHGAGTRAWDRQIAALKGVYAVHVAPEARGWGRRRRAELWGRRRRAELWGHRRRGRRARATAC